MTEAYQDLGHPEELGYLVLYWLFIKLWLPKLLEFELEKNLNNE